MTDTKIATLKPAGKAENLVKRAMAELSAVDATVRAVSDRNMQLFDATYRHQQPLAVAMADVDVAAYASNVAAVREAAFGETNPVAARALFGLMLDAIPAARNINAATYIDALTATLLSDPEVERGENGPHTRGGFTPVVLAAAMREIWRTATFAPSIAEVLEACRDRRRHLQASVSLGERFLRSYRTSEAHGDD